jgi:SAM-dependent methyltransferase
VVGTYRDDELERHHPLRIVLGDLPRVDRIRLEPLSAAAVAELAGAPADDLYTRTGGNPFYVTLSPVMVDTARRLAAEQGVAIRFEVGDAESLPYEDASFDVVASALGVFLAPDHAAAGRELARVCRPGGRLGVVAWRPDPEAERMHAPFWPAREPGTGDRRDWGREEYVAELLGQEFELEFDEGELQVTAESGEQMWRLFTSHDGAAKAQVGSLDPRRADEYRRAYVAHHERYRTNGRISLPRRYLIVLGRRRTTT